MGSLLQLLRVKMKGEMEVVAESVTFLAVKEKVMRMMDTPMGIQIGESPFALQLWSWKLRISDLTLQFRSRSPIRRECSPSQPSSSSPPESIPTPTGTGPNACDSAVPNRASASVILTFEKKYNLCQSITNFVGLRNFFSTFRIHLLQAFVNSSRGTKLWERTESDCF